MAYELKLEAYQGPLDKLLELIEEKKMEITRLNLAEVTADFLAYIEKLEKDAEGKGIPPGILADFLVVASRLILIKSKALLPDLTLSEEEEGEVADLEHRLRLYRELKEGQRHLAKGWNAFPLMHTREFLMGSEALFYPPARLVAGDLAAAFGRVLGELERIAKPTSHLKSEMENLSKKISEVLARLTGAPLGLGALRRSGSRGELVVLFLAILHLLKTQLVKVEQADRFGEIIVARSGENA
ncbi:MAG: segregation/condensation protein A [Candidatus Jorgensenbacteria bacterium]